MSKHIVRYFESERGWGSDVWTREFDSEQYALAEVEDCNKQYNFDGPTPEYYIIATYEGVKG